jgi:hypothetical protein
MDAPNLNPYEAPRTEQRDLVGVGSFPRLATKARVARAFLLANVPVVAVAVVLQWLFVSELVTFRPTDFRSLVTLAMFAVSLGESVLRFATAVAFLVWFHAACERAMTGVPDARFTPAMGVVRWFVPLANVWLAFDAMRHLWQLSIRGVGWRDVRPPSSLTAWWIVLCLWPVGNVLAIVTPWSPRFRSASTVASSFSACASLVAALFAARIVREITAMQRARLGVE